MGGCADFFIEYESDMERCKALQKKDEALLISWESETASAYSPGPVSDDEVLYRQMLNPTHYDAANKVLKVTAFSDAANKGGSVNRARYQTLDEAMESAASRVERINERKAEGEKVELWQIIKLRCDEVRSIMSPPDAGNPGKRAFAVYDTALQDAPSHADICQIVGGNMIGRSVRSKLLDLANAYLQAQRTHQFQ